MSVFAQPLCDIKNYTLKDGFSQSTVTSIIQDKKGLIWISTRNGLSQFDGYTFINYKSYPGDGCTMQDSRINEIKENAYGDIWCLNQDNRAYLFDVNSKTFIDVLQQIEEKTGKVTPVVEIFPLKKGVTWILCDEDIAYRVEDNFAKAGREAKINGITEQKIKGTTILNVYQDKGGDEWILTDKGITIFGKKHFNLQHPFCHFKETGNTIWLASKDGLLAKYEEKTGDFRYVKLPSNVNTVNVMELLKDKKLVLGTDAGLVFVNTDNLRVHQVSVKVTPTSLNMVLSVFQDNAGDLWMSSHKDGVIHYSKSSGKVSLLQSPKNDKLKYEDPNKFLVTEDNQGYVWVIPRNGNFCYFDRDEQKLKYYYADPEDSMSIVSPPVRPHCIDNQGNLWFGYNQMLGKLSFFDRKYTIIPIGKNELEVRSFMLDKYGCLWVGSKGGTLKILDEKNRLVGYVSENGTISSKPISYDSNVYCMTEDYQGNVWIGTRGEGLYFLERSKQNRYSFKVRHFSNDNTDKNSLSDNNVYALFKDSKHRIWVGTYGGGLNLVNKTGDGGVSFIHSGNFLKNYPSEYASRVRFIAQTNKDVMMFGTMSGLFSFSTSFKRPEDIHFFRNTRKANDAASLSNNDVMYIFTDSKKRTYVLTQNGGINQIVSDNMLSEDIKFKLYTEHNQFFSDLTLSMIEDNTGGLWIVSKQTLSKFYPSSSKYYSFGSYTFRQDIVFSEAAISTNASGNVMVGTNKGILMFDPTRMEEYDFVPPIIFTGLKVQGEPYLNTSENVDVLILKPSQRNLSIQFSALDYKDSKWIQYAYKMEGLDKNWHFVNIERNASYINLPHGKYRFLVKSTNSTGVWVDNTRSLSIEVKPTFWETGWAWLLITLVIIVLILFIVYVLFTIYRLRHEVEIEQKLSDIKLNFFTDVSHELRTPLTLIASPVSEILDNEPISDTVREHLTVVQKNTNRMLRLVNQILDFRKIQYNKMKVLVEETDVVPFVSRIMDNFQLVAREKNIFFQLENDETSVYLWIDKDKFEKIIFNLLSNAFKYTPANKSVTVRIKTVKEKVQISVIDEGVGIIPQKLETLFQRFETLVSKDMLHMSSGIGLSLVKELVELHHANIEVFSQPGLGSEFMVSFQMGNEHFREDDMVEFILSDDIHYQSLPLQEEAENTDDDSKWSILIVEDSPELLRFLMSILSKEHQVIGAVNGQDGLEKAQQLIPDMIVSDVIMPVMDGLDMVKAIKENEDLCHIPIILLSSKDSLDDRINGLERGIDDYIAKPFNASYLQTRIRYMIRQRIQLQELYLSSLSIGEKLSIQEKLKPAQPQISSYDELFIQHMMDFMEKNMDNVSLSVTDFADAFSMSRAVFYKKTKSLLGISPVDFMKDIRIKRAVQLIDSGMNSFTEVAYMCGFSEPNYFSKCFKKEMGVSPSEYKSSIRKSRQ